MLLSAVILWPRTWKLLSFKPGFLQRSLMAIRPGTVSIEDNFEFASSILASLFFQLLSARPATIESLKTSPALASHSSRLRSFSEATPPTGAPPPPPPPDFADAGFLPAQALAPPDFTTLPAGALPEGLAEAGFEGGFSASGGGLTTLGPEGADFGASFLGLGAADFPDSSIDSDFSLIFSNFILSKSGMKGIILLSPRNFHNAAKASVAQSLTFGSASFKHSNRADTYPFKIFLFVVRTGGHLAKLLAKNDEVSDFTVGVLIFNAAKQSSWIVSIPSIG